MSNDKLAAGPDERAAFEAWAARSGCHTKRSDKDRERYHAWLTNALWNGWQGRAACAALAEHEAQAVAVPQGFALVPLRMTKAMQYVTEQEDWSWEDLLAAAEAITEEQYGDIAAAPQPQAAQAPATAQAGAARVTAYNVGRWCKSEDECIEAGIDFAAYERGVADAAIAFTADIQAPAAQQAREPLTWEQFVALCEAEYGEEFRPEGVGEADDEIVELMRVVRMIERAHGIGTK